MDYYDPYKPKPAPRNSLPQDSSANNTKTSNQQGIQAMYGETVGPLFYPGGAGPSAYQRIDPGGAGPSTYQRNALSVAGPSTYQRSDQGGEAPPSDAQNYPYSNVQQPSRSTYCV